jgi:uroporphyrinogen III methyltransferase / synthase
MTADSEAKQLTDRTVVIVGPGTLAPEFLTALENRGAALNTLPAPQISEPENHGRIDEAIDHLYGYDWLLFTSVHGAEYFLRRLHRKEIDPPALDELRVCAVGEETEELLRLKRVHVDVVPETGLTTGIFAALSHFLGGSAELNGLNLLSPRGTNTRDALTAVLSNAGARIDLVPAYRVGLSNGLDPGRAAAMLSGAADCIVLTGRQSVAHLTQLFDSCDLQAALGHESIVCFDEITAKAALGCGLKAVILPTHLTVAEFADAIAEHCGG